jgi:shikimate dehydrogenase
MKVLGIISDHRAFKSRSPGMHNHVIKQLGLQAVYVPFNVSPDRVGQAVEGVRALGIAGMNVTVPYKEQVIPFLDECSPEAEAMGAVNTIVNHDGRLSGHNTDVTGLMETLETMDLNPANRQALVIGAGGVARACVYALKKMGAERITVAGRDLEKTAAMAGPAGAVPMLLSGLACAPVNASMIINAASVSSPDEAPELATMIQRIALSDCRMVMDLNYGRTVNMWRDLAERNGSKFVDGLPLLARQACHSFRLWTGEKVEAKMFIDALEATG